MVLSRLPFETVAIDNYCGKADCRHVAVTLGEKSAARPGDRAQFLRPGRRDEPDPAINVVGARSPSSRRTAWRCARRAPRHLVGDPNVAPPSDVWSHKQLLNVVAHPGRDRQLTAFQKAGNRVDVARILTPEPTKLYTWWSYRAHDWKAADRGRRLDHIWVSPQLGDRVSRLDIAKAARGWERPSDHVPVTAAIEV